MAKANKHRNPSAEEAYKKAHAYARQLLKAVENALGEMPAPENPEEPIHWGHVGSVSHAANSLLEIAEFLSGKSA